MSMEGDTTNLFKDSQRIEDNCSHRSRPGGEEAARLKINYPPCKKEKNLHSSNSVRGFKPFQLQFSSLLENPL